MHAPVLPPDTHFASEFAELCNHAQAGRYAWCLGQFQQLLDRTPSEQIERRAQVLAQLAQLHPRLDQLAEGVRCASETVALAARLGDDALLTDGLTALSYAHAQLLMGRDALDTGWRALAAARRLNDPLREAWALTRVGVAHASLDHLDQAIPATEQALELAQPVQADDAVFAGLNNLAYFWLRRAEAARALQTPQGECLAQARSAAERAVAHARHSGSAYKLTLSLSNWVDAHLAGPSPLLALPLLNEFGRLAHEHGYEALMLEADIQRAVYLRRIGEPEQAAHMLGALLADKQPPPRLRRLLLQSLYEAEKACGNTAQALHWLESLMHHERRIRHDMLAVQAEVLLIRERIEAEQAREEHARAEAQRVQARVAHLELEQRQLRDRAQALDRAAHEDALTGLHNRRQVEFALPLLIEGAAQAEVPLSLAVLDADHFKQINDRWGHATGDAVLVQLAQLLRQRLRGADLLARVGGEEFLAVMVDTAPEHAAEVCERLRLAVQEHPWHEIADKLQVTLSIGLCGGLPPLNQATLQARADEALYAAKRSGRNRICVA